MKRPKQKAIWKPKRGTVEYYKKLYPSSSDSRKFAYRTKKKTVYKYANYFRLYSGGDVRPR